VLVRSRAEKYTAHISPIAYPNSRVRFIVILLPEHLDPPLFL